MSDDSGEFSDSLENVGGGGAKDQVIENQHFDEAHEVSADDTSLEDSGALLTSTDGPIASGFESKRSPTSSVGGGGAGARSPSSVGSPPAEAQPRNMSQEYLDSMGSLGSMPSPTNAGQGSDGADSSDDGGAGKSKDDDGRDSAGDGKGARPYDAEDYKNLNVSPEVRDLFDMIGRYTPQDVKLDTQLKPFIPDYIPAVGDIDSFIKVPHPEGKRDLLGLVLLDEPAAQQSDPTVLDMRLRLQSKHTNLKPMTVRSIENAHKEPKKIQRWIENIQKVHREKPRPTVIYSQKMPDIEQLMQVWPPAFEDTLKSVPLPPAEIDLSTEDYARVACAILDIPVHGNVVESLHVLFTLFSEFKKNQHFQQ